MKSIMIITRRKRNQTEYKEIKKDYENTSRTIIPLV